MVYIVVFAVLSVLLRVLFQMEVHGKENIVEYKTNGRPYIVCPNHISALDPLFVIVLRGTGRKLTIMAKEELFKNKFFGWFLGQLGAIAVARGTGDKDVLEKAINDVKNGAGALVFPEGTRGNGNEMGRLKTGAFAIAAQTKADIIPVRIIYRTEDGNMKFFRPVTVVFGKPLTIEETQLDNGSRQQIRVAKAMLEESYAKMLEEYL